MKIVQATNNNLTELMSFYSVMCDVLGEKSFLPNGDKGGFPSAINGRMKSIKADVNLIGIEIKKIVVARHRVILQHGCEQCINFRLHGIIFEATVIFRRAKNEVSISTHLFGCFARYGGRRIQSSLSNINPNNKKQKLEGNTVSCLNRE